MTKKHQIIDALDRQADDEQLTVIDSDRLMRIITNERFEEARREMGELMEAGYYFPHSSEFPSYYGVTYEELKAGLTRESRAEIEWYVVMGDHGVDSCHHTLEAAQEALACWDSSSRRRISVVTRDGELRSIAYHVYKARSGEYEQLN